jgi:hypothetical protein
MQKPLLMAKTYPNKWDAGYLRFLKEQLSEEHLIKTAMPLREPKLIDREKPYTKCVYIDFFGLSSNTLLGADLHYTSGVTNYEIRREIAELFKNLFDPETKILDRINEQGIMVKVRFCLNYLYSDYPICLMKAEHPDTWVNLVKQPNYDFTCSYPLNESQFQTSNIRKAQEASLESIMKILRSNKSLIYVAEKHGKEYKQKNPNTFQVRFAVIPSPLCILVINRVAICDVYLYAPKNDVELPFYYPVTVITKHQKNLLAKDDNKSFDSIRQNLAYLWKHDLTIFCSDGTKFRYDPDNKIENFDGLVSVLRPTDSNGKHLVTWNHKIKRMKEKTDETKSISDETIELWENNLYRKFSMCTRKIESDTDQNLSPVPASGKMPDLLEIPQEVFITLGSYREDGKPHQFLRIDFRFKNQTILCAKNYAKQQPLLLFRTLAHYCHAKKHGKTPIMNGEYFYGLNKIIDGCKKEISNSKMGRVSTEILFDSLFAVKKHQLELKVPAANIFFEIEDGKSALSWTYLDKEGNQKDCFNYAPSGKTANPKEEQTKQKGLV